VKKFLYDALNGWSAPHFYLLILLVGSLIASNFYTLHKLLEMSAYAITLEQSINPQ
jgi:hypothetical protein